MQVNPVKFEDPADCFKWTHVRGSFVFNGITVVGTVYDLKRSEVMGIDDTHGYPTFCYEEAYVAVEDTTDGIYNLYVTKPEDLVPLCKMLEGGKYGVDIRMSSKGFTKLMAYDPNDPSTNPMLCPDCGT